jgi:hypothetical protein
MQSHVQNINSNTPKMTVWDAVRQISGKLKRKTNQPFLDAISPQARTFIWNKMINIHVLTDKKNI